MPDLSPMTKAGYVATPEEWTRLVRYAENAAGLVRALTAQLEAQVQTTRHIAASLEVAEAELREWQSGRRVWVSPAELDAMIERHDPSLNDPDAALRGQPAPAGGEARP